MSGTYSGSYMGFPAPPQLKPWHVAGWQRRRAAILRAAGIAGEWRRPGDTWLVVTGQAWRVQDVDCYTFTCWQARERHGGRFP